jgi:hypothetical protein
VVQRLLPKISWGWSLQERTLEVDGLSFRVSVDGLGLRSQGVRRRAVTNVVGFTHACRSFCMHLFYIFSPVQRALAYLASMRRYQDMGGDGHGDRERAPAAHAPLPLLRLCVRVCRVTYARACHQARDLFCVQYTNSRCKLHSSRQWRARRALYADLRGARAHLVCLWPHRMCNLLLVVDFTTFKNCGTCRFEEAGAWSGSHLVSCMYVDIP